jgi:HEAT repeat protein
MENGPFGFLSALIGFIAGVLATIGVGRLRQPVRDGWEHMRERLQGARRWVSSGVESRYRHETAEFVQGCHLGKDAARLDEIFVPTAFVAPPPEPGAQSGQVLPEPQMPYLWPELAALLATAPSNSLPIGSAVLATDRLAVLAPPGGGKSTLLAYLTLRYSDDPEMVPLYAHLAELSLELESDDSDAAVETPLLRAIQRRAGPLTADALPNLLRQALEERRAVVLLDGWDELAPAEREDYTRWLEQLVGRFPEARFIVSAPPVGYGPLLRSDFVALHLRPWRAEEITDLLLKWAAVLNLPVPTVSASQELGAEKVPDLGFWQPGQTALDATLGVMMQLTGRTTSARQARRFGTGIQFLLGKDSQDEAIMAREIGPRALAQLAGWMDQSATRIAVHARLEEFVAQALTGREEATRRDLQQTVDIVLEKSGLLAAWGHDRITFRTPALYAYFWAANEALASDQSAALGRLQDPEWSLPISFLIEMTDSGPVVEQLLLSPPDVTREQLFRVADWLAKAQGTEQWHRIVMVRLAQLLLNPDTPSALRERAAAALVATQDEGVGFLLRQAIASPNPALRAVAAAGLGALAAQIPGWPADEKSLEALVKALEDPSETVQAAVISALGRTRSKAALEALIRTLLESHATARRLAAEALGRMGTEGHEVLREALTEDEVLVRRAALYGLAQVSDGWVNETLEEVVRRDSEWFIRSTAEEILSERLAVPAPEKLERPQAANLSWLISLAAERGQGVPAGPKAMEYLKEALEERQRPAVRAMAARSLGDIGEPDSSPLIAEALHDPDHHVREAAFFALARLNQAWNQSAS